MFAMLWVRAVSICLLPIALTGCGGGGGSPAPVTLPPPTTPIGGATPSLSATQGLLTAHANPVSYASISALPTTGTFTYNGYAYGDLSNTSDGITDTLIGDMEMTVTFTASSATVSGQINGFTDDDGDPLTGSLALSAGALDRAGDPNSDSTFGVDVNGALTDDASRVLSIGARFEGDFIGANHAAVGGEFLGTVASGGSVQDLDGGFIGER